MARRLFPFPASSRPGRDWFHQQALRVLPELSGKASG